MKKIGLTLLLLLSLIALGFAQDCETAYSFTYS